MILKVSTYIINDPDGASVTNQIKVSCSLSDLTDSCALEFFFNILEFRFKIIYLLFEN